MGSDNFVNIELYFIFLMETILVYDLVSSMQIICKTVDFWLQLHQLFINLFLSLTVTTGL